MRQVRVVGSCARADSRACAVPAAAQARARGAGCITHARMAHARTLSASCETVSLADSTVPPTRSLTCARMHVARAGWLAGLLAVQQGARVSAWVAAHRLRRVAGLGLHVVSRLARGLARALARLVRAVAQLRSRVAAAPRSRRGATSHTARQPAACSCTPAHVRAPRHAPCLPWPAPAACRCRTPPALTAWRRRRSRMRGQTPACMHAFVRAPARWSGRCARTVHASSARAAACACTSPAFSAALSCSCPALSAAASRVPTASSSICAAAAAKRHACMLATS